MTFSNNLLQVLNFIATIFPVLLLSFTFKGFFQALIAKLMGDSTAQDEGFLTVNPLVHVDIPGLLVVMFVLFVLGGIIGERLPLSILLIIVIALGIRWIIPVPVNDSNFKYHRLGGIVTAFSGSFGNFILGFLATLAVKFIFTLGLPRYILITLLDICKLLIKVSLFFGVLNLIPLPPFDGGKALHYLVSEQYQYIVAWLEQHALYVLLVLFFAPGISTLFFQTISIIQIIIEQLFFVIVF